MTEHAAALKLIAATIGLPGDASPMEIARDVIRKLTGTRKNGMGTHLAKCSGLSVGFVSSLVQGKKNASPEGARKLEQATGIAKELWVFGTAEERREAVHAWWLKRRAQPNETD